MEHLDKLSELYGHDLAYAQLALEAEAYRLGAKRFNDAMEYKASQGQAGDTNVARPLISSLIPKFSMEVIKFIQENTSGRPGKKAAAFRLIQGMDPDKIAFIAIRALMNCLSARPKHAGTAENVLQPVMFTIGAAIEDEARFGTLRDQDAKYFETHVAPQIQKRSSDFYKRTVAAHIELSMVSEGKAQKWDRWTNEDRAAVGLKCVEIAITIGIVQLDGENIGTKAARTVVSLTDEAAKWLEDRREFLSMMVPAWQPTVIPPKPWTSLKGGGYWGRGHAAPSLVRGLRKHIKKRYRDVDMTNVLNAINVIQATPWQVNAEVLSIAQQVVNWENIPVKDLPSFKMVERPERIEGMDEDKALLKKWKKQAALKFRAEKARRSRRMSLEQTIETATKFAKYERIWFPHNADFRGRVYAIPQFSPQGTDLTKGLLLLADPKPMGKEGEYWLRLHLANTAGLDKAPMDERQQWTHDNEALILDIADNPLDNLWWATDSDSPFCFLAACFEFARWKRSPNPEEYCCGIAVAFDGTCSGIQHFSAMLRDEVGGAAVNLVPADRPSDIYRIVADKVNAKLDHILLTGSEDLTVTEVNEETGEIEERTQYGEKTVARWWKAAKVTRSVTKRSVMTLPYGSKKFGFADQLLEDIIRPMVESEGEHCFPAPAIAARFLAGLIWDALGSTVVAAVEAMAWLQKAAGALASQDMGAHWVTPVGFPVWQEYRKSKDKRIDTFICGSIRVCATIPVDDPTADNQERTLDKLKQVSAISPNFVHSMDGSHLMLTALAANAQGVDHFAMIHDSFGTCPGNAGTLFKVVRDTFVETYSSRDVIQDFHDGFSHLLTEKASEKIPALPPKGNLNLEDIRKSLYCFG